MHSWAAIKFTTFDTSICELNWYLQMKFKQSFLLFIVKFMTSFMTVVQQSNRNELYIKTKA